MKRTLYNLKQKKCARYWPDEGSQTYGGIKVTLDKKEPYSDFIIRTFAISKVQGFFISKRYITLVKTWVHCIQ